MPARKRVVEIERRGMPVTGEGFIVTIFVYIRISDGVRDEWLVLTDDVFEAVKEHILQWAE